MVTLGRTTAHTILVVDDEPEFCSVVCEILELYGFAPKAVHDAHEALAYLEHAEPDLILTDVMMPEIDGLTLLRRLRAHPEWSHIPAAVLTAKAAPEALEAARKAGADGTLVKPFSAQELLALVHRLIPEPSPQSA